LRSISSNLLSTLLSNVSSNLSGVGGESAVPFSPTNAGSKLGAWYDATDAATITAPAGVCSAWNDKSTNARHLAQAGASTLRPTWDGTKMSFDGGDYLFNSSPWMYANGKVAIYMVCNIPTQNGTGIIAEGSSSSGSPVYQFGVKATAASSDNILFLRNDAAGVLSSNVTGNTITAYDGTKNLVRLVDSGLAMAGYLDGTAGTTIVGITRSGSLTLNRFAVGCLLRTSAGAFMTGDIYEIIICTDDTYAYEMEGYLAWKHGLTSNLPSWHPYKSTPPTAANGPVAVPLLTGNITAAALGDSITAYMDIGGSTTDENLENVGAYTWYNALAGNRMKFPLPANNLGIAGNTTVQMVSRMTTDLPAITYDTLFFMGGTNDIVALTASPSAIISSLNQIADYNCLVLGKRLIWSTITARSNWSTLTAPQIVTAKATMDTVNAWIMAQHGTRLGRCVCVDAYAATTDGAGGIVANMAYDDLHFGPYGAYAVGKKIKDTLVSYYGNNTVNYTTGNLLSNPTLSGTGGTAGSNATGSVATGYTLTGVNTAQNRTGSKATGDVQQLVQNITSGGATDEMRLSQTTSSGFSVGDTVYGLAEVEIPSTPSNVFEFRLELRLTGTGVPTKVTTRGFDGSGNSGSNLLLAETYSTPGVYTIFTPDLAISSGSGMSLEWRLVSIADSTTSSSLTTKITKAGIFKR